MINHKNEKIIPEAFYHIYNRGNNRQSIFFNRDNYLYFLNKIRSYLINHLEIVAYCLMPNHFHFLVYSKKEVIQKHFSHDLRIMISSYTRAINKQEGKTGSLFQQHTKVKPIEEDSRPTTQSGRTTTATINQIDHYPFVCFHYIHQNPLRARLVKNMEDWEMSSYRDYVGARNGSLCNRNIAYELLEIPESKDRFIEQSMNVKIFD